MRKVISIITLIFLLTQVGCETERRIFNGPYFIRFTDTDITLKESHSQPDSLEVHYAGPALDEDLIVSYAISGNAREGVDYTILETRGKVTIKAGDYFANIIVKMINNSNDILRSQDIIFTLQSVSSAKVQVGQGDSAIGNTFTFTIVDDCILGGDYIGQRGSPNIPGITITSTDCETYTLSNFNINVFSSTTQEMPLKFVDNGDNTLTIPEQEEPNLNADQATISGTGVVDPLTRKITMTVKLVDFTDQPEVTFTLIPN
jgi:hypothetical protein